MTPQCTDTFIDTSLLHCRELRRRQERISHTLIDRPVLLALSPRLHPFRIREKRIPLFLAVC